MNNLEVLIEKVDNGYIVRDLGRALKQVYVHNDLEEALRRAVTLLEYKENLMFSECNVKIKVNNYE